MLMGGTRPLSTNAMTGLLRAGYSLDWVLAGRGHMRLAGPDGSPVAEEAASYRLMGKASVLKRLKAIIREVETDWKE